MGKYRDRAEFIASRIAKIMANFPEICTGAFEPRGVVGVVRCINKSFAQNNDPFLFVNNLCNCKDNFYNHGKEIILRTLNE